MSPEVDGETIFSLIFLAIAIWAAIVTRKASRAIKSDVKQLQALKAGGAEPSAGTGGMKLHHVGVAVESLDAAIEHYEALGLRLAHREVVASQKVEVAFMGERPWVELVAAAAPDSKIAKYLESRGEGQHHVAFGVPSVAKVLAAEKAAGRTPIDAVPRPGAWGHTIAFLHPKDHGGALIELVEESH